MGNKPYSLLVGMTAVEVSMEVPQQTTNRSRHPIHYLTAGHRLKDSVSGTHKIGNQARCPTTQDWSVYCSLYIGTFSQMYAPNQYNYVIFRKIDRC